MHQTRGLILVALSAGESTSVAVESVDDDATVTAESTAMVSAKRPSALPELNALEIPFPNVPLQHTIEHASSFTITQRIEAFSPYLCLAYLVGVA